MTKTVYVHDADVWEAARLAANISRQSLGQIVEKALIHYLRDVRSTCVTCERIREVLSTE
jgi:hypothetical protein